MRFKIISLVGALVLGAATFCEAQGFQTCDLTFQNGGLPKLPNYGTVTVVIDPSGTEATLTFVAAPGLEISGIGVAWNQPSNLTCFVTSYGVAAGSPGAPVLNNGLLIFDGFGRFTNSVGGDGGSANGYSEIVVAVFGAGITPATFSPNTLGISWAMLLFPYTGNVSCSGFAGNAPAPSNPNNISTCVAVSVPPSGLGNDPTMVPAFASEPINTANGNYFYQHTDLVIPGRAMPLTFQRSYNSLDTYSGPLGGNWTHSYNIFLTDNGTSVTIKWGDGHNETFTLSGGVYLPPPGVFSTLIKNPDGTFVLTRKDQTKFSFAMNAKVASIADKNGNTIALTYDSNANLVQISDTVGRNLTFIYDASNRITQVTDPIGRTTKFSYSGINDLVQVADPAGGVTQLAYDANHRVTSITLPNNQILLQNAYDGAGHVVAQTNGRGLTTTLAYATPAPGSTTIVDARGNKAVHAYDGSLRIIKITDPQGGVVSYTYDGKNDRTSVTNQNGNTTLFAYDGNGNLTGITDPLGSNSAFTYDAKNNLVTATNPKGAVTTFSYDSNGNLLTIQDALGHTTNFTYDGFGEITSKIDANTHATTYMYDSFGSLSGVRDPLGHATSLSYDGIGRLVSLTDPNGHSASASYDALSRLLKTTDPLGSQTQFVYDPVGNLLSITDANGNATAYAYDATNDLMRVTDALGQVTQYAYDPNNNRISYINAKGNTTTYTYDSLNRLSTTTDPLSFVTAYVYDPTGNMASITDANGKTNKFVYDSLDRLTDIIYADGKSVTYAHDADGNRTMMTDSHGTTTYQYDPLDRLTTINHPGGMTVAYAFDAVGNRSTLTYPDGKVVSYGYDSANHLSSLRDWLGRTTAYSYDPTGNLLGEVYPNGAGVSFFYDSANRLIRVGNFYRGSTDLPLNPVTSFSYVLDPVGNRLQITDGSGKATYYAYDLLNELTTVTAGTNVTRFVYDSVGNRVALTAPGTSIAYSYDAADRLITAGSTSFAYDANGNQIMKTSASTGIAYAYDAANRLTAVNGGGTASGFAYDGDGNRVAQTVPAGAYSYLNDVATALPVVLQEAGPDGNISYAHGIGLMSETSSTFSYFYQDDGLGSVAGLTDANGKLAGRYTYDAWGQSILSAPDPQIGTKNKFRFTGEALDPGTGLYYLRARYYDPSAGRLNTGDTVPGSVLVPLSLNRYNYALSNPTRYTDPTGHDAWNSFFGWCSGFSDTCASIENSTQKAEQYDACTQNIETSSNGCNNNFPHSFAKTATNVVSTGVNVTIGVETAPAVYGVQALSTPWWWNLGSFLKDLFWPKTAYASARIGATLEPTPSLQPSSIANVPYSLPAAGLGEQLPSAK